MTMMIMMTATIIVQFNSYLFARYLNSPKANYKVSMSERNTHKVKEVLGRTNRLLFLM
jgi:hypothetical protein